MKAKVTTRGQVSIPSEIRKKFNIALDIQNILDERYIDRKGYISSGIFIMGEVALEF